MKKCSFPPSVTPDCSVLVLGSLPGDESLRQAQYYAHPRNAFWKIMGSLLGFDPSLPYGERLSLLNRGGVGLWDVVASGVRPGSLDQHISQEQPNDIAALLDSFPGIGVVCCNGTASHKYLKRYFPELFLRETLSVIQMPSTSPAAARLTYEQKFRAYEEIMAPPAPEGKARILTFCAFSNAVRGPTVTGGGVRSAGPDGRQQVDIQGQGFVNIEIQIITEPVEGLHALQQFVHGHLGGQRAHLRMNRSDFRGS